jgi:ubiquinone biosynthesis protein
MTREPALNSTPDALEPQPVLFRQTALRSLQIAFELLRAGSSFLAFRIQLRHREEATARALGRTLTVLCSSLGATFIKIGQIASTRGDLLPRALVAELAALQDQVPPFSFSAVRATIESEFDRPLEEIFTSFDPTPLAAASVAQVHRAEIAGKAVAVKVRRPNLVEKVAIDRTILLFLGRMLERIIPSLRLVALEDALRAFCDAVAAQIHLRNEVRNNQRFQQNFSDDPAVAFPQIYLDASSDAVLTMEFIEGIHESDLEAEGCDVHAIVSAGMRSICRMIFLHGFVHADLHPGNLRFTKPSRIVFLDLGLVGELSDEDRILTTQTLFAFATGDGKTVARLFHESAPHVTTTDYETYEHEMCEVVSNVTDVGLGNIEMTTEIGGIFDILRRHGIQARSHMTMVHIALVTAEGLGKRLAPDLSLAAEALPWLQEALTAAALDTGTGVS